MLLMTVWRFHALGNDFALLSNITHHNGMLLGEYFQTCLLIEQVFFRDIKNLLLNLHDLLSLGWIFLALHHGVAERLHVHVDALEGSLDNLIHVFLLLLDHVNDQLAVLAVIALDKSISPALKIGLSLVDKRVLAFVLAHLQEMLQEIEVHVSFCIFGVDSRNFQACKEIFFVFLAPHFLWSNWLQNSLLFKIKL